MAEKIHKNDLKVQIICRKNITYPGKSTNNFKVYF
jgi:hypothetical protein